MRGGHIYKHINCLDMHLQVVRRQYMGPTYGKYKVRYIDKKGHLFIEGDHTVTINHKDLGNWNHVTIN